MKFDISDTVAYDPEKVEEYMTLYENGIELPLILVRPADKYDGNFDYIVLDGNHRLVALMKLGVNPVRVAVTDELGI